MQHQVLINTARSLMAPGKGILAADESTGTIKKRLDSIGVESTEQNRQAYRNLLFTTAGAEEFISGVILFQETLFQKADDGTPFPDLLTDKGIIPGIKVDMGAKPLAGSPEEKVTEGLDGLRERLSDYAAAGARFAKWRGVIDIAEDRPTDYCIHVNAHALARYAALCQEAGIVPIVEPEVLMDGANSIERCEQVTDAVLDAVFTELKRQNVLLEGMLLKPNMVISGKQCPQQAGVEEVARATLRCLNRRVPAAVPGIVFLSGGQSDELATAHLDAMNRMGPQPWALSFSYGRALQAPALQAWRGQADNVPAAQQAFLKRARNNGAAARGEYNADMESAA
ncbi:class I fructose-bisphosphate aldolase [Salinisphaera hydrothermalis]|uniref:Fructose-bisphosphate aldolase n=1 Tax=Salinisphaera hydrothermalis (strain C41B8) TaxID=1304275 RepID=A0A084IJJ4_SALHC|nr:class I fructose-bisphosphate aldolase [Salinisphaera hydrothermalis]KEZ76878.1 Fructose-bisphosphate aldolase [Salinisphaera hydrothermalis C41B8]